MRFISLAEVLRLHRAIVDASGGATGLRDLGRLESAGAQPHATFDGDDLYPDIVGKSAALGFAIIQGHPFVDGNKRVGHAAMEVFLVLNGFEIHATVDEQERTYLRSRQVASRAASWAIGFANTSSCGPRRSRSGAESNGPGPRTNGSRRCRGPVRGHEGLASGCPRRGKRAEKPTHCVLRPS